MICAPSIRSVWSESSLSAWRNTGSSATHWEHCKKYSDQVYLSLRWAHRSLFCWFCHEEAEFFHFISTWCNNTVTCKWAAAWLFNQQNDCAQRRLRSAWAHMPFCWFCGEVAQIAFLLKQPLLHVVSWLVPSRTKTFVMPLVLPLRSCKAHVLFQTSGCCIQITFS